MVFVGIVGHIEADVEDEEVRTEPAVVPLSHMGVVDIDGIEVTDIRVDGTRTSELFTAHAGGGLLIRKS